MQTPKGLYTGRFQPFSTHHLHRLLSLHEEHPDVKIAVGVADWKGKQTRANFLTGDEAARVTELTLFDNGIDTDVISVPVAEDLSLAHSLIQVQEEHGLSFLFSGSEKTIHAARSTDRFRVIELQDDDVSGPRARHIRASIIEGTQYWKKTLSPSVVAFFEQLSISERLRELPDGEKRPWAATGETMVASTISRDRR